MTIWKYRLEVTDEQCIEMPREARLLTVQVQHGEPCLWAMVEKFLATERRMIYIKGTGHDFAGIDTMPHIGTFQLEGGQLVFHVFDGGPTTFRQILPTKG